MSNPLSQARISRRTMLSRMLSLTAASAGLGACGTTQTPQTIINDCRDLTLTPSSDTVQVHFLYSTEKDAWLQNAITAFQSENHQCNGKPIEIIASSSASVDMVDQILHHQADPDLVACSPASELELSRLVYLSALPTYFGQSIVNSNVNLSPEFLVQSPLVFAVWKQFADTLRNAYTSIDWNTLYQAMKLLNGWQDLKHQEWGTQIHLGQTLPTESNSGLLALTLMANAYLTSKQRALTADTVKKDPDLWDYIDTFESRVNVYGKSSGTYWDRVVGLGSGQYAIVLTYENLVLRTNNPQLEMFYPTQNLISNHPFAILNNPLLSRHPQQLQEQQQAARAFRDFLRRDDQQKAAMQFGFRPWNTKRQLADPGPKNDPKNPFDHLKPTNRFSSLSPVHTLDTGIDVITAPGGDVVDALITKWKEKYPNPTAI